MRKLDTFLKLSPTAAAVINDRSESIIAAASCRLPMVVPPVKWERGMTDGGGFLTSFSPLSLFKTRNRSLLKEYRELDNPDFDYFLEGHNVASGTGYRIDRNTLSLLKLISKQERKFAKLPALRVADVPCPLTQEDQDAAVMLLNRKPENLSNYAYIKTLHPQLSGMVKAYVDWRGAKHTARQKAVEQAGAKSNFLRTLEIAEGLVEYPSVYFPTQSDDRGRVYYSTPLLNPQGADHEKALLEFDVAKKIGVSGWKWLQVNVSNLMGFDKGNFEQRVAYVNEHREMIESCVKNPMSDFRWEKTDKPFQFLQAARELVAAWKLDDPTQFESRMGIACDASCSGLQILGTLTRCVSSMKFTNCLPAEVDENGVEFMQDIYGEAARIATGMMTKVALGELSIRTYKELKLSKTTLKDPRKEEARQERFREKVAAQQAKEKAERDADMANAKAILDWSYAMKDKNSFTRNWLKRNTMTFFYGSAKFGMRQQLIVDHLMPEFEKAEEIVGKGGDVSSVGFPWATMKDAKEAATLAGGINYDAICAMAEKPAQVMKALQKYAELIAKSGRKMRWTTPVGLVVEQRYEKTEKLKIDSMITGQKRMQTTTQRSTGEVDANGQKNGAAPNWVHSLDASLLLRALAIGFAKFGLKHWRVVHDSFAVHAADTEVMVQHLKDTMADMLDSKLLERTREELTAQVDPEYRSEIIPFPELGEEYLVDELRKAQYPFC